MKTLITRAFGAACAVGCLAGGLVAQDAGAPTSNAPAITRTETTTSPSPVPREQNSAAGNAAGIQMNFRNAPLEQVLEYLSEAAGFIIVLDAPIKGTVNVISAKPMSQDEAVDFLSSALNKNGLAAIRDGRTLTIIDRTAAKTRDIPVKVNNDPRMIPKNDEIVTQIIPIRYVEAEQLAKDLVSFISPQATFVANAAGNSIVMTDTQANIRHMVEIIKAIDSSAEAETEIRVFHLTHASPSDVASALSGVFPSTSSSGNNNQAPVRFGGGPFGGAGGFAAMMGGGGRGGGGGNAGRGGGSSASGQNDRIRRASQVMAVADSRTSSVIVTASKDLMSQIVGMVRELDVASTRDQQVHVFRMNNGDPQQAAQVLQNMFQSTSGSRTGASGSAQNSALMQRQQNNNQTTGSTSSGSGSFGNSGGGRSGGQLF